MKSEATYSVSNEQTSWGERFTVVSSEGDEKFKVEVWLPEPNHPWKRECEVNWQACGNQPAEIALQVAEAIRLAAEYAQQYDEAVAEASRA